MRLTSQSTSLWCFHKELIQSILIWRFHNPYSFRARLSNGRFRLSNEGWIFWIRFCNDLREAPCVNARGPLYSQIWHHSKVFPFSFAAVKHLLKEKFTKRMETLKWPLLRIDLPCKIPFSFGKNIILSTRKLYIQMPSIHCYFWESISWYISNDKGLYRKIQQWRKAKLMLCHFKLFPAFREISPQA